jgi:hypothetical protein
MRNCRPCLAFLAALAILVGGTATGRPVSVPRQVGTLDQYFQCPIGVHLKSHSVLIGHTHTDNIPVLSVESQSVSKKCPT